MKINLSDYLQWLREGAVRVVSRYPVETGMALYGCVGFLLNDGLYWDNAFDKLCLVPLFFLLSLAVNRLAARRPWRWVYWISWMPLVPLSLWSGIEDWVQRASYPLSLFVLAPLLLLMSGRAVCNRRFMEDALNWLRSFLLALLFANVALGLFYAVFQSMVYIFGLQGYWTDQIAGRAVTLAETLAVPLLFLMLADRRRNAAWRGGRICAVLLDYIVTPALLVYTAILYLYLLKIVVTWTLPEGGVAYLVFGFTIAALAVKSMQHLLEKRHYDWFFDRFSLLSLPLLALFWVGVLRRTGEYGLTGPRVYLIVCGALMTLCVLLFLSRRTGRYLWISLAGFIVFAALAFVPRLNPQRIAVHSQAMRVVREARNLNMLDSDGTLRLAGFGSDSTRLEACRRLYEALDYVADKDTVVFARFGVGMEDVRQSLPQAYRDYVMYGVEISLSEPAEIHYITLPSGYRMDGIEGYRTLYTDLPYWPTEGKPHSEFKSDTLRIYFADARPEFTIAAEELLRRQLRRAGIAATSPDDDELQAASGALLTYKDDEISILFSDMSLRQEGDTLHIWGLSIEAVLCR